MADEESHRNNPLLPMSHNTRRQLLSRTFGDSSKKHHLIVVLGLTTTIVVTIFGVVGWKYAFTPKSLLPNATIDQMEFTPYFYRSGIPLGYSATPTNMSYSRGLLSVRLTKPNSPDITISQQKLPHQLRPEDVLTAEKKLDVPFGVGTINQVEGRLLGSIVTNDPQPILILISSQSSENQAIVIALAEALVKVR